MIVFWAVSWSRTPVIGAHAFFPLWASYIATVNGLGEYYYGHSLLRKLGLSSLWLFAISIPFWWFFELLNLLVENWRYVSAAPLNKIQFFVEASISFSTVVPAVMSTIHLCKSLLNDRGFEFRTRPFSVGKRLLALSVLLGTVGLCLLGVAPKEAFPLVWICPLLIVEPLSYLLGCPSLLRKTEGGDYGLIVAIVLASFLNGLLWELWNFNSLPKWRYAIPYVGFWKVFEMPLLGYLGYPFFGLIVYSFTVLAVSLLNERQAGKLAPPEAR